MNAEQLLAKLEADAKAFAGEGSHYAYLSGCMAAAIRGLYRELADYKTPHRGSMRETTFCTDAGEYVIHYDYQPEERATHLEPGCSEEAEICAVYINGANVLDDLSPELLSDMETACLDNEAAERIQAEIDYAEMRATA